LAQLIVLHRVWLAITGTGSMCHGVGPGMSSMGVSIGPLVLCRTVLASMGHFIMVVARRALLLVPATAYAHLDGVVTSSMSSMDTLLAHTQV
jgi:hypothetical protein